MSNNNTVYPEFHAIWRLIDNNYQEKLLQHADLSATINAKQRGYTPLQLAIVKHHHEIIRILLANGADPNTLSKQRTPLYMVTLYAEMEMMALLIEFGANVDAMCGDVGPIHIATARGIVEACEVLANCGANLDLLSKAHGTPLHICVKKDHKFIAKYLLSKGANPHAVNSEGETCIFKACQDGNTQILRLMLEKATASGCAIPDRDGNTALHIGAINGHLEIVTLLIERFPSLISIQNNSRKSVLFYLPHKMRASVENSLLKTILPSISFSHLVNKPYLSDVTITSRDSSLQAHSCILWARWPKIRPLLEKGGKTLTLGEESHSTCLSFLHYLYSDSLFVPKITSPQADKQIEKLSMIQNLKQLAKKEELPHLVFLCNLQSGDYSDGIHQPRLLSDMETLLSSNFGTDVTVTCGSNDQSFPAHKIVLSAHSEYFRAMFDPSRALRESASKTIKMSLDVDILKNIITYLYTFKVPKKMGDTQLLEAATQFMLHELSVHCQMYLGRTYTEDNVYDLLELSDHLHAFYLRENCLDYLIRCYPLARSTESFKNLPDHLKSEIASNFSDGLK